jgi:hypothetical protein
VGFSAWGRGLGLGRAGRVESTDVVYDGPGRPACREGVGDVERHSRCTRPRRSPAQELWISPMSVTAQLRQQRARVRRPPVQAFPKDLEPGLKASRRAPQARSAEEWKRRGSCPGHLPRDGVGRSRRRRHRDDQSISAPRGRHGPSTPSVTPWCADCVSVNRRRPPRDPSEDRRKSD